MLILFLPSRLWASSLLPPLAGMRHVTCHQPHFPGLPRWQWQDYGGHEQVAGTLGTMVLLPWGLCSWATPPHKKEATESHALLWGVCTAKETSGDTGVTLAKPGLELRAWVLPSTTWPHCSPFCLAGLRPRSSTSASWVAGISAAAMANQTRAQKLMTRHTSLLQGRQAGARAWAQSSPLAT